VKLISAKAKHTKERDVRIQSILNKYASLNLRPMGTGTIDGEEGQFLMHRQFVEWSEEGNETKINIEVFDETIAERLASELKACGCVVKVYTEEPVKVGGS
jgi:hypothetical protein